MAAKKRSKKAVAKKVSKRPAKKAKTAAARGGKKVAKRAAKKAKAKAAAPVAKAAAPKKAASKKAVKAAPPAAAAVGSKKARKSKSKKATRATGKAKEATPDEEALESSEASSEGIGRGSRAPGFKLADQSGDEVSSNTLKGTPYVLYFYPKDETTGCTVEACDFRDNLPKFDRTGVRVIGVSPDGSESHAKFSKHHGLGFTLLADTERELANSYGVWVKKKNYGREYMGIQRSTFLIDAKGVVRGAWRGVKVPGHVAKVLSESEQL